MKNIWILISKYNAVFLFILFFGISFLLVVTNNGAQRASAFNSSNAIAGRFYAESSKWSNYLKLSDINEKLLQENARLHLELSRLSSRDTITSQTVVDSMGSPLYTYIPARVINNSIRQKNNYITLDKGADHGISKGMAVIGPDGVVGIVIQVSPGFSTVQSLLHADSRISAALADSHAFGSLIWGGNYDSKKAILRDIPNHVEVRTGEAVVTSGYSLFPPGIPVGKVIETAKTGGESFLDISIELSTDFHNLQYVYIVTDHFQDEKQALENTTSTND